MHYVYTQRPDEQPVLEVRRTDQRVAEFDAYLFRIILGRKAWVEEQAA